MSIFEQFKPSYIWQHDIVDSWHTFLVHASVGLDAFMGIALCVMLFMRMFQMKFAGKAILPMIGAYCVLKVVLP